MPAKATHAIERAPQVELATLSQLKELVALYERKHPRLTKPYMQDFLRFRLTPQAAVPIIPENTQPVNDHLAKAEAVCREHCPDVVNEVLDLLAPFCDPSLSLEFRVLSEKELEQYQYTVMRALFWTKVQSVVIRHISPALGSETFYALPAEPISIEDDLRKHALTQEVEVRKTLDSKFGTKSHAILEAAHLYHLPSHAEQDASWGLIRDRLTASMACKYRLLRGPEEWIIFQSILAALYRSIDFMIVGDHERAALFTNFLAMQRSGAPVVYNNQGEVVVLCA